MSEPTVAIPARILIRIACQLRAVDSELFPGRAPTYAASADLLQNAIAEQLTGDEATIALVATELERAG